MTGDDWMALGVFLGMAGISILAWALDPRDLGDPP